MIWQRCHVSQFESAALARLIEFRRPFPTPNSSKKKFLVNINYENYHWLVSRYSRECGWINGHNRKRLGGVGGGGDGWDGWMDGWMNGRMEGSKEEEEEGRLDRNSEAMKEDTRRVFVIRVDPGGVRLASSGPSSSGIADPSLISLPSAKILICLE